MAAELIVRAAKARWRAGRHWPQGETRVDAAELSPEARAAIAADPVLSVSFAPDASAEGTGASGETGQDRTRALTVENVVEAIGALAADGFGKSGAPLAKAVDAELKARGLPPADAEMRSAAWDRLREDGFEPPS